MYGMKVRGGDLAAFVRGSLEDQQAAGRAALRMSAHRSARDWRGQIGAGFRVGMRISKNKWTKGVVVRTLGKGTFEVSDKAAYLKKRSQRVTLSWVFENSPMIQGRRGWTAVPIEEAAPRNGKRYLWPSEAAAAGYELYIAPVMGKRFKIIFGRRGPRDEWRPMWFYIPPYRAKKGLDLAGIHRRHDARLERVWAEEFDKLASKRATRR